MRKKSRLKIKSIQRYTQREIERKGERERQREIEDNDGETEMYIDRKSDWVYTKIERKSGRQCGIEDKDKQI